MYENELYHHGVKGMKWGVRKARGHAGPGKYVGKKRQLAGYKRDLETLDKGSHLSVGMTKKRQEKYDKRDRAKLEKDIAKLENEKAERNTPEAKAKRAKAIKIGAAAAGTALAAYGTYKVSKMLKNEAARRSYESGNKYAERYFRDADKYSKLGRFDIETNLLKAYRNTLKNTDRRTAKVSKSTVEAIKYLRHPEHYIV